MSLSPPHPSPIPLNALRAFETAARHQSFLRAAEELSVTPGAVAQQVRKLEDWADARLFDRHAQGVTLTPHGAQVLDQLTTGFEQIGQAARRLRQGSGVVQLRIAALPAIAQLWLAPRLSKLRDLLPGCEISVHALDSPPPLTHAAFDLALYFDTGPLDGVEETIPLAQNRLLPVAAPKLAAQISDTGDLTAAVLIHDAMWRSDWANWSAAAGLRDIPIQRGPVYSLYALAVERCIAGDGVLIGHNALIEQYLAGGALVALFEKHALPAPSLALRTPVGVVEGDPVWRAAEALRTLA